MGRTFNRKDIGVIAESKEKYSNFNIKVNVKLAGLNNKDVKEVRKNIQLRFIDSVKSARAIWN